MTNKNIVITEGRQTTTSVEVVEDATATVICSIVQQFVGEPRLFKDCILKILNNLYCMKLTDFRWYNDMFNTQVILRGDCNNDYLNE